MEKEINNMIPKIIHYCWFGPNPIPEIEKKCIVSWKKFFPDFEFKFWNEKSFDINSTLYTQQAYKCKKFAFVSDYVRVNVLSEYGGLYLDTDEEVLSSFSEILETNKNFMGFVTRKFLGCGVMGFHENHPLMNELLEYYNTHPFLNKNGNIDNIANTTIQPDSEVKQGLKMDRKNKENNDIVIYNREVFYPKKLSSTEFRCDFSTIAVHHASSSWMSEKQKKRGNNKIWINVIRPVLQNGRKIGLKVLGENRIYKIEVYIRNKLK